MIEDEIINGVLVGKNNYLFLYTGLQTQFDYLLLKEKVDPTNADNFAYNIKNRVEYFLKNKIKYKHIVFPSKPLVKKAYLPDKYAKVHSLFETYYKKKSINYQDNILYPLNLLLEEENKYSTFHIYDTHMTDKAYFAIIKSLLTSLNIEVSDEILKYLYLQNKGGDLTYMLSKNQSVKELSFIFPPCQIYEIGNRQSLPGNTDEVLISYNKNAQKRLLIFGDSFLKDMVQIFSYYFKDVLYIRSTFVHYDIVEMYQPDLVITGTAERYLSYVESEKNANNFLLSKYGDKVYSPIDEYLEAFKAQLAFNHYPHIYNEWEKKIQETILSPLYLSIKLLSKDIKLIKKEDNISLYSTYGNDPYIVFNDICIEDNIKYEFEINFDSNVASKFQLFYTTDKEKDFDENKSIKKKINKGLNNVKISLEDIKLGSKLRIDPINTIGEIKIYNYIIQEINKEVE